jgi:hypothetical protein
MIVLSLAIRREYKMRRINEGVIDCDKVGELKEYEVGELKEYEVGELKEYVGCKVDHKPIGTWYYKIRHPGDSFTPDQ